MDHKNRQAKHGLIILLLILISNHSHAIDDDGVEIVPANRHQISVVAGMYSVTSPDTSISSLGSVTVSYTYRFMKKISAFGSYNNLISTTGGGSAFISGFDIGGQYCFLSCTALKQNLGGIATITQYSKFGIQAGGGFAQRSVAMSTASVGFSGPFGRVEMNYNLSEKMKVLATAQYLMMSNAEREVTQMMFMAGIAFDFGGSSNKKEAPKPEEAEK